MRWFRLHRLLAPVLCVLAVAAAPARGENMQVTTAGIALGGHVSGPAVGPDDLVGRVVVLEFWGLRCAPCLASMPGLEELHRQLGSQGVVIIGAHAQGGTADELRKGVADLGVTFTIVEGATVEGGMDFGGIPHCMVFDHTGACIFRGSPGEAHDRIVEAAQAAPAAILAGRPLVKLAALAQTLKNEAQVGSVLQRARPLLDSKDADTADEARFIVDRIEGRGRTLLGEARGLADADPAAATTLMQRVAAAFRGSDIGTEAGRQLAEWKKDKEFQANVRAGLQLARLAALQSAAEQLPGGATPPMKTQAREILKALEKSLPGSEAAAKAAAMAAQLGVDVSPAP